MLKLAIPALTAFLVVSVPAPAFAAHCKCTTHHVAHAHTSAPKTAKWVAPKPIGVKRVTTTTTVERTVHYSPPQVVERVRTVEVPVYIDRPVYVDRHVYVERRVAVPVYQPVAVYPRPVYRRVTYHQPYYGRRHW